MSDTSTTTEKAHPLVSNFKLDIKENTPTIVVTDNDTMKSIIIHVPATWEERYPTYRELVDSGFWEDQQELLEACEELLQERKESR
jgi:hypothetical protein